MPEDLRPPRFDLIASFYDLDYEGMEDDIALYARLAERERGPILELGCGTGRVLVPLAARGYDCTGVDISPAMLEIARSKLQPDFAANARFVHGDMRTFDEPAAYRLGFFALDTFRHLTALEDQLQALRALCRSLVPGGLAVLDLTNPDELGLDVARGELVLDWIIEDEDSRGSLTKLVAVTVDPTSQTQHVTFLFDEADADGIVKRTPFVFDLHYFYPREVELLLTQAGFEIESVWGNYDFEAFTVSSPRMIYAARRARSRGP